MIDVLTKYLTRISMQRIKIFNQILGKVKPQLIGFIPKLK